MRFLADENFPASCVLALRNAGLDVAWVRTENPGDPDESVLNRARLEGRLILTFDKDFGDFVFRRTVPAGQGFLLFRLPLMAPDTLAEKIVAVVTARSDWAGHFRVASERERAWPALLRTYRVVRYPVDAVQRRLRGSFIESPPSLEAHALIRS